MEKEMPNEQASFTKERGTYIQLANVSWIRESTREYRKIVYLCFITFDYVDHATNGISEPSDYTAEEYLPRSRITARNRCEEIG